MMDETFEKAWQKFCQPETSVYDKARALAFEIRAAALEEAAKVAEAQTAIYVQKRDAAPMDSEAWERYEAMRDAAEHIAGSIRDRAGPAAGPDQPATYVMQTPHGIIGYPVWE